MSGPTHLEIAKGKPYLLLTPMLIRPTSYPRFEREGDGYRVHFSNIASENLRFFIEKPDVVSFGMGNIQPRGSWADHFFTVMHDAGRYRMWYEVKPGPGHDTLSHLRYAESDDGIDWKAPRLRLPRSTAHGARNRVYPVDGHRSHGATVFQDASDGQHPYKLVTYGRNVAEEDQIEGATSCDGLNWTALDEPLVRRYMSDTQSVAAYNPRRRKYVGFFRYTYYDRRGIGYAETDDFENWPRPEPVILSSSLQEDIYTNGYTVYPRNPDLHFLFPALYKKNADNFELAAWAGLEGTVWARVGTETFLKPEDIKGTPDALVCAGVGLTPLDGGARIGLPVGYTGAVHNAVKAICKGRPKAHYHWAVWDRDRLGGVRCEGEGGFATIKLNAPAGALTLNYRTGITGELRVQVLDEMWNPLPGYTFDDCRLLQGDGIGKRATWKRKRNLPSRSLFALQFYMRNASLYSFAVT